MASTPVDRIPLDRLDELCRYIPRDTDQHGYGGRVPRNAMREIAAKWLKDKPSRMSPWGLQFKGENVRQPGSNTEEWLPPMPLGDLQHVCGRWIRDLDLPADCLVRHPRNCKCFGWLAQSITVNDTDHYGSGVLTAYQHGEIADESIDLAEPVCRQLPPSSTDRCMLQELPVEILELILEHLAPAGGHTYHFFPTRSGQRTLQVVQRFVPEDPARSAPELQCRTARGASLSPPIATSVHMALAATSSVFQHLLYQRFYSQNRFILHLTSYAIHSSVTSSSYDKFQSWSRTYEGNPSGALGPLTARAASYMRNVMLIATFPHSHTSKDHALLEEKLETAVEALRDSKLQRLAVHLHIAQGNLDPRYRVTALPVGVLEATVENGNLSIVRKEEAARPKKAVIRESNRAQQVLQPLFKSHLQHAVKFVEVSGAISEGFKAQLEAALKAESGRQVG